MITITLSVKTMEGLDASDAHMTVDIVQVQPIHQPVAHQVIQDFNGTVVLQLDDPDDFPTWQVTVSLPRFDPGSGFFFQPRGEPNPSHTFQASRLPGQWTPQFTPFAQLPSTQFSRLSQVVAVSDKVDLKSGPSVGDLSKNYDIMAGNAQVLAKMALLNLYAVLTDEEDPIGKVPWFSYVQKIIRLDQERFLAEVDATLFENVQTIINELSSTYGKQDYFTEPPADMPLHIPNIPLVYDPTNNLVRIITLKKDYEQGNVQLTLSFLRVNGVGVHILDCDMDENRNILMHSFDIIKHMVTGGTNPVSMHEYIVEVSAQQSANGISTLDLGYQLV
ncbi:MAG: hypothetical protein ABSB50_08690 [Terracidiphilus sp.]|jgi:hypothetical protein